MPAQLQEKREIIKRLTHRLQELSQLDDEDVDDDEEDLLGDEKELGGAPANGSMSDPISGLQSPLDRRRDSLISPNNTTLDFNSTLRSRHTAVAANPTDITSTTTSSELFSSTKAPASTTTSATTATATTEALMTHNREEQETLTESLLSMAQALRQSSQAFASSLESEKEVLDRTVEGLDKNATGMEAAEKRMGTLRRMTEGKGWWGRMLIYAYIVGLMLLTMVIVGVLPKLRF